jgi:hypothetical protein
MVYMPARYAQFTFDFTKIFADPTGTTYGELWHTAISAIKAVNAACNASMHI